MSELTGKMKSEGLKENLYLPDAYFAVGYRCAA